MTKAKPTPEEIKFWKYLTYDEEGFRNGIREDAPEEMKRAYEEFLKMQEAARKRGEKI